MDDNDVSLPKATIVKLIKDAIPSDMRVGSDTTEMILSCCTEFVQLVSSEANEVATRESKQTILPEHVLRALKDLGFPDFVQDVSEAWGHFKEEAKASHHQKANLRKTGADQAGLTEQEQIALQQQMFAAARAASLTSPDSAAAMAAAYQAQLAAFAGTAGASGMGMGMECAPYAAAGLMGMPSTTATAASVPALPRRVQHEAEGGVTEGAAAGPSHAVHLGADVLEGASLGGFPGLPLTSMQLVAPSSQQTTAQAAGVDAGAATLAGGLSSDVVNT